RKTSRSCPWHRSSGRRFVASITGKASVSCSQCEALLGGAWFMKTPVIIAVVGLPGAGKTEATTRFVKHHFVRVGFNDIFYEEFDRWGLERNEKNEQLVRVEMRNKFGLTVLAERALPIIEQAVQGGKHVLIESFYTWWDYTFLKERLRERFHVLAI